jgi:ketosteroid isomerase-like protein
LQALVEAMAAAQTRRWGATPNAGRRADRRGRIALSGNKLCISAERWGDGPLAAVASLRHDHRVRPDPEDERVIRDVLEAWATAIGDDNWDAYAALFSDDDGVQLLGTDAGDVQLGLQRIADAARPYWFGVDRLRLGDVRVSGAGETAWATMDNASVERGSGASKRVVPLRITALLQRRGDNWLIQQVHLSKPAAFSTAQHSLFFKAAEAAYTIFRWTAPSDIISRNIKKWAKRRQRSDGDQKALWAEEGYIFLVTVALVVGWLVMGQNSTVDTAALVVAVGRGLEVFGVALGIILVKSSVAVARRILTVALYGIQVPLILAITTHFWVKRGFTDSTGVHPTTPLEFLYVSWSDMTTLGNHYIPTTDPAKILVLISGASGVILLGVFLSLAVTRIGGASTDTL